MLSSPPRVRPRHCPAVAARYGERGGAFRRPPNRPSRRRLASVLGRRSRVVSSVGSRRFPFGGESQPRTRGGPTGKTWRGRPRVARCTPGPAPAAPGETAGASRRRDVDSNTRFSRRVSVHTSHLPRVAVMFVSWELCVLRRARRGLSGAALPKTLDTSHNLYTVFRVPL